MNAAYNRMGGKSRNWNIVEPLPCPVEGCTANYIRGLFPDALDNQDRYDVILHTHCMEHMQDLHVFLSNVVSHIVPKGSMIFVVPDMKKMMEYKMTSTVNFEHSIYLSDDYVEYLLGQYGFRIDGKEGYCDGHSLIYVTTYTGEKHTISLEGLYEKNKKLFIQYYEEHTKQIDVWNRKLDKDDRNCYLFAAHISSQLFAAFGLNLDRIKAVLDNSLVKIGGKVLGIEKEVCSPAVLKDQGPVIVILPRTPYADEIKKDILEKINPEVEFWMMK